MSDTEERHNEHRILVCGGRTFTDMRWLTRVLDGLDPKPTLIIQGGAFGADACASEWAYKRNVLEWQFPAAWAKHGRAAGPIRNQQMLDEGKPHLVIAFPGANGTADMVRRSKAAGIPVLEIRSPTRWAPLPRLSRAGKD